jgi:hypothetical protein
MHDVDRTQLEYSSEISEYGELPEYSEFAPSGTVLEAITGDGAGNWETGYEYGGGSMGELMEDELASEFLEISNDQELDHFLGSLISKAAKGIGKFVASPAGKALGGMLKQVAKKALPIAGGALGTFIGGPVGGALGGKLASMAGDAFGLEFEGLSGEDRDFEVAKRYVRFAHDAARTMASAPTTANSQAAAKAAIVEAAKRHAPGLLTPAAAIPGAAHLAHAGSGVQARPVRHLGGSHDPTLGQQPCVNCGGGEGHRGRQGRWIRRGRHIVLLGV